MYMNQLIKNHNPKKHAKSFKYAFNGIFHALLNEANFRIQVVFTIIVVVLGIYFNISNIEWAVIVLASGFLLAAELGNTVVEVMMDHLIPEESQVVKIIKDLMAGFVLIAGFVAIIIFLLIFGHVIL